MSSQQLRAAYDLIKTGQKDEAAVRLRDLLDEAPDNADAWWLYANAATDPADIRRALEHDLRLRPEHMAAKNALAALNRKYPPPAADQDDVFDEWFADDYVEKPKSAPDAKPARPAIRNNQAWILYGAIGLIVLFVCGGLIAIAAEATRFVGEVVNSEEFRQMQAVAAEVAGYQEIPEDAEREGNISVSETKREQVDTFIDDVWTFAGRPGQRVIITLSAADYVLDPQLYLFHPDGYLMAENDDRIPEIDLNSEIQIVLPDEGRYTIVVSAFGQGGDYDLYLGSG